MIEHRTVFCSRPRRAAHLAFAFTLTGIVSGCGFSQTPTGTGPTAASASVSSTGLNFKGTYTANTPYGASDVVSYKGSAYVGLTISMNVPPAGNNASAADWALLVAAGQNGAQGLVGPQGATGPQGLKGDRGSAGPGGPAGPAGAVGQTGAQGLVGAPGATGSQGQLGPAGPVGPAGPTGPTGPTGARGADASAQTVSALRGHGLGILGDSISVYNPWQPTVVARTGAVVTFQDARPGRIFAASFECYGAPARGNTPGVFQPAGNPNCGTAANVSTIGNTLAQNLATTDMLLIRLGTNDVHLPLGNLGDPTTSGTIWGDMRWVVETLLAAKPTLRVILVTPELNQSGSPAMIQGVVDAEIAYGSTMGIPVLDLYRTSGNNPLTNLVYTSDGTHPNAWSSTNVDGPAIAQFILRYF